MKLEKEKLLNLIQAFSCFKTIPISEIPDIDLYMDQVTTFMEDKLEGFKRTEEDKILTKTMINNYTKNNIIPSPIKKKYSKKHMMLLILTYHMKQILSIGDIHYLLSPITEKVDMEKITPKQIEKLYHNFLEIQSKEYATFSEEMLKQIDELDKSIHPHEEMGDAFMLYSIIFHLIVQASMQKKLAEDLIDNFLVGKNDEKNKK
ncbi:MAG: DUF1836 domain-containing protein [Epulopiscium sp.]|nr:DUF1836 domain-containing protein [Candidatus Epulonipiscium sp.]